MNNHRHDELPIWLTVTLTIGLLWIVAAAGWVAGLAASGKDMGW